MNEFEEAIEALGAYAQNAERIATAAKMTIELMHLLANNTGKHARGAILPAIKDQMGNLPWDASGEGDVGQDSNEGIDQLEEVVASALEKITGSKMDWHPHI